MPCPTPSSALLELYWATPEPGEMWKWEAWKNITGVHHGLFPDDDSLLPHGWTRANTKVVKSFFDEYKAQPLSQRLPFSLSGKGSQPHPGKTFWTQWVNKRMSRWGIHDSIINELHEAEAHPMVLTIQESSLPNPTMSSLLFDDHIPHIVIPLTKRLFGDDAFKIPDSEFLPIRFKKGVQALCYRSWDCLRRQIKHLKDKPIEHQKAAEAAFKHLETEKPTKIAINKAMRALRKWQESASLLGLKQNVDAAEEMLAQIQAILEALGAKVKNKVTIKAPQRVPAASLAYLKNMSTPEDIEELMAIYQDYFEGYADDDQELIPDNHDSNTALMQDFDIESADFGMDFEAQKSSNELAHLIGFRHDNLPPIFNKIRHRRGADPWSDPEFSKSKNDLMKNQLYWHQIAAVCSFGRTVFKSTPDASRTPSIRGPGVHVNARSTLRPHFSLPKPSSIL
ncbi:hypothetical protein H0H87_008036 [Tephrocybe sp. NHM501043]|nr:hypothetical protein H0H87_008036 [Tephrocybe sp. NHM501043]